MTALGDGVVSPPGKSSGVPLVRVDLGKVPYERAQADMANWVEERQQGLAPNRLFLLTHPPVITYTARTEADQLPDPTRSDIALVQTGRGGHATYHGPGQLIGYLVLDVREIGPRGLIRRVEEGLIDALDSLGFPAIRREAARGDRSLTGVWTPDHRKVASIGMRINSGRVSSHGLALNIDSDLSVYTTFTACALPGVQMTSLAQLAAEQGRATPTQSDVRDAVAQALADRLETPIPARVATAS
ncbi:lipoyl(octanoyl) transferase LipB [Nocardiopsis tropica]|uniref:lipoyl(octanoyl) transferase LipB n=1 Tax=Nocardiopsis tropica TaxID=109330 RepID=UPI002E8B7F91|nr:lipoyl(octanoyl) transferase LipB [Nocardiopsis tropica]